ncbi:hypothetical protein LCGC14_0406230 [marine sediment metagenome]|uniref:Uncharacterized protein n=1 Tax=marine sediment metagenome TaxID=412755 RepID=A0A0F9T0Z4_9ZZZZ
MPLTPEQQEFVKEVDEFKIQSHNVLKEARELDAKAISIIKRFNKLEKIIKDMAKEHGL